MEAVDFGISCSVPLLWQMLRSRRCPKLSSAFDGITVSFCGQSSVDPREFALFSHFRALDKKATYSVRTWPPLPLLYRSALHYIIAKPRDVLSGNMKMDNIYTIRAIFS